MYCLDEALNKLRIVEAKRDIEEYNRVKYFWRGMKNMKVDVNKFFAEGGSELAPMSTTEDLNVATDYAMSEMPLLFRFEARGRSKGVDIGFLSLYPREKEVLYPALTDFAAASATTGKLTARPGDYRVSFGIPETVVGGGGFIEAGVVRAV